METRSSLSVMERLVALDQKCRLFLRANAKQLTIAEEGLRGLALLVPGGDSELRAEIANTLLGLLAVYRDSAGEGEPRQRMAPVVLLSVLRTSQVLLEFGAERSLGKRKKFLVLWFTEIAKAALRLILLSSKNGSEPLEEANEQLQLVPPAHTCQEVQELDSQTGARSGRKIVTLAAVQKETDLSNLFEKIYDQQTSKSFGGLLEEACGACRIAEQSNGCGTSRGQREVTIQSGRRGLTRNVLAELLHILRPVIHLSLVRIYGWKSWKPWLLPLVADIFSIKMMSNVRREKARRVQNLLFYLLRSPFYDNISGALIGAIAKVLGRLPLIGDPITSGAEVANKLQKYYFYISAS
mmetsp:Transcript_10429/g.15111  ORF Transcript_10429/g.15111 Transcript_10429/m.15111 type:complete len:353 (-) Transcript_10429:1896-2954(-)